MIRLLISSSSAVLRRWVLLTACDSSLRKAAHPICAQKDLEECADSYFIPGLHLAKLARPLPPLGLWDILLRVLPRVGLGFP
jgi:hypothetical protein